MKSSKAWNPELANLGAPIVIHIVHGGAQQEDPGDRDHGFAEAVVSTYVEEELRYGSTCKVGPSGVCTTGACGGAGMIGVGCEVVCLGESCLYHWTHLPGAECQCAAVSHTGCSCKDVPGNLEGAIVGVDHVDGCTKGPFTRPTLTFCTISSNMMSWCSSTLRCGVSAPLIGGCVG